MRHQTSTAVRDLLATCLFVGLTMMVAAAVLALAPDQSAPKPPMPDYDQCVTIGLSDRGMPTCATSL